MTNETLKIRGKVKSIPLLGQGNWKISLESHQDCKSGQGITRVNWVRDTNSSNFVHTGVSV